MEDLFMLIMKYREDNTSEFDGIIIIESADELKKKDQYTFDNLNPNASVRLLKAWSIKQNENPDNEDSDNDFGLDTVTLHIFER